MGLGSGFCSFGPLVTLHDSNPFQLVIQAAQRRGLKMNGNISRPVQFPLMTGENIMGGEHENGIGEQGQRADLAALSEAETRSGEDQRPALQSDDIDLPKATLREAPINAMRRRAERRQTSALIALWGEVERRSGEDQRTSPSTNDTDHD